MSTTTQKRRLKRKEVRDRQLNERRNRDRGILMRLLEDWEMVEFEKAFHVTDTLLRVRVSPPRIEPEDPTNLTQRKIFEELSHIMKSEQMHVPGLKRAYSPNELFSIVLPVMRFLKVRHECGRSEIARRFKRKIEEKAQEYDETKLMAGFFQLLLERFWDVLNCYSRMTNSHYIIRRETRSGRDSENSPLWNISETKIPKARLSLDGETRTVFRCGLVSQYCGLFHDDGIDWVSWDSTQLNLGGPPRSLPVFVQSHVFERLYGAEGRLNCFAPSDEAMLHEAVYKGLRQPVVHENRLNPRCVLVEYGLPDCKLGYLVCQVLDNAVVARTFLFLTMDGTPEGDKLYERLRVNRYDKSHLGLDTLAGLRTTDYSSDPVLRRIFDECGLGHIFEELSFNGIVRTGYASSCHSYLGSKRLG